MRRILVFGALLIIGCSQHPKVGDYYEDKGTRARVKVEYVGLGKYANKCCEDQRDLLWNAMPKGMRTTKKYMITYINIDSNRVCVALRTNQDIFRPHWMIAQPDFLEGNYKLVE